MVYMQQKVNQQVNRPQGPKARPSHLKALAEARQRPRVRVEPTRPELRDLLKHPNGMGFRSSGSVEWPFDRFTQRRLREGSIKIVEGTVATAHRQERARAEHQAGGRREKAEEK